MLVHWENSFTLNSYSPTHPCVSMVSLWILTILWSVCRAVTCQRWGLSPHLTVKNNRKDCFHHPTAQSVPTQCLTSCNSWEFAITSAPMRLYRVQIEKNCLKGWCNCIHLNQGGARSVLSNPFMDSWRLILCCNYLCSGSSGSVQKEQNGFCLETGESTWSNTLTPASI